MVKTSRNVQVFKHNGVDYVVALLTKVILSRSCFFDLHIIRDSKFFS